MALIPSHQNQINVLVEQAQTYTNTNKHKQTQSNTNKQTNMMVFQHQREKSPTKPNKTKNCFLNSEQENYNKTGPSVRIFPTQKNLYH